MFDQNAEHNLVNESIRTIRSLAEQIDRVKSVTPFLLSLGFNRESFPLDIAVYVSVNKNYLTGMFLNYCGMNGKAMIRSTWLTLQEEKKNNAPKETDCAVSADRGLKRSFINWDQSDIKLIGKRRDPK